MIALRTVQFPEFYWAHEGADDDHYDSLVFLLMERILKNCVILSDSEGVLLVELVRALESWPSEHQQRAGQIKRKLIAENVFRQTFIRGTACASGGRGCGEAATLVRQLEKEIDGAAIPSRCSGANCVCQSLEVHRHKKIRVDLLPHQDAFEKKRSRREAYRVKAGLKAEKFNALHIGSLLSQAKRMELHDRYVGRNLYDTLRKPLLANDINRFRVDLENAQRRGDPLPKFRNWSDISHFDRTIQWLLEAAAPKQRSENDRVSIQLVTEMGKIGIQGDAPTTAMNDLMAVREMLIAYEDCLQRKWKTQGVDVSIVVKMSFNEYEEMDHWRYFVVDHLGWVFDRGADLFIDWGQLKTREAVFFAMSDVEGATSHNKKLFDASPENILCLATNGKKALRALNRQSPS